MIKLFSSILILFFVFACNQNQTNNNNNNSTEVKKNSEYDEIFKFSQTLFDGVKYKSKSGNSLKLESSKSGIINNIKDYNIDHLPEIVKSLERYNNFTDFNWDNMQFRKSTCQNEKRFRCDETLQRHKLEDAISFNKSIKFYLVTIYFTDELTHFEYYFNVSIFKIKDKLEIVPCIVPIVKQINN